MNNVTIYIDGRAVGCCNMAMPKPASCSDEWRPTISTSCTFKWLAPQRKSARRSARQMADWAYTDKELSFIKHYRRVKQHQLRKRQIRKRRHA